MLTLDRVSKVYKVGTFGGTDLPAVREVSFAVDAGQVVSLIGESGSGKTTIGRMILRLTRATHGTISFDGEDVARLPRKAYYRTVQGVFQDPFSSYNPIFKADHVFGMIRGAYFPGLPNAEWESRVEASLQGVGLDAGQVLHKYPHQLSGGQLQRLLIARALLLDIRILVADEIISMLDASTRIDVLNLLGDLKARGLGILFITHDLSLGYYSSQRTVILRRGRIVEMGATTAVFERPLHPYTQDAHRVGPAAAQEMGPQRDEAAPGGRAGPPAPAEPCRYHGAIARRRRGRAARSPGLGARRGRGRPFRWLRPAQSRRHVRGTARDLRLSGSLQDAGDRAARRPPLCETAAHAWRDPHHVRPRVGDGRHAGAAMPMGSSCSRQHVPDVAPHERVGDYDHPDRRARPLGGRDRHRGSLPGPHGQQDVLRLRGRVRRRRAQHAHLPGLPGPPRHAPDHQPPGG